MGFLDALSGGGVSNEPNFVDYTETFSDQPVRIQCDTNFAAALPCTAIPYCVKIQIHSFVCYILLLMFQNSKSF